MSLLSTLGLFDRLFRSEGFLRLALAGTIVLLLAALGLMAFLSGLTPISEVYLDAGASPDEVTAQLLGIRAGIFLGQCLFALVVAGVASFVFCAVLCWTLKKNGQWNPWRAAGLTALCFAGLFASSGLGFAGLVYLDGHQGNERALAATSVEATQARKALAQQQFLNELNLHDRKLYLRTTEKYAARARAERQTMEASYARHRLAEILLPHMLITSDGLAAGRERLSAIRRDFGRYEAGIFSMLADFETETADLPWDSETVKQQFDLGVQKKARQSREQYQAYFAIEKSVFKTMDGMLALLESAPNGYRIENGELRFSDSRQGTTYEQLALKLEQLTREENRLLASLR